MQVEVVRQGGIAGVRLAGTMDTAQLPRAEAEKAESALSRLPFGRLPAPAGHPDSFQYQVSLIDGGARRTAILDEAELPAALRPMIDAALAGGHGKLL